MNNIDINETLLKRLKTDYNEANDQVKFMNGLDYMEAMVKLFAVINIAVVKHIDDGDVYKKIFLKNFKNSPSLGDYKSLATKLFLQKDAQIDKDLMIYDSLKNKDPFYDVLYKLFTEKIKFEEALELDNILKIIEEGKSVKLTNNDNKPTNLQTLFDNYIVSFRNKLKGHGASFNSEDKEQSQIILKNLEIIITTIESRIETLLLDDRLSFFIKENESSSKDHEAFKVFAKYDEIEYQLSPLMIYHKCNKFSCKDDHKEKLFFYNDSNKKGSTSYYIDYSYNHYYYFSSNNEINDTLKEIVNCQKEQNAHSTSNQEIQSELLSVFVGRKKELKVAQEHIVNNINSHTAITIKGKPGIGKSAFISKLQDELTEEVDKLQTYIFYSKKLENGSDESEHFFSELSIYLSSINIDIPKHKNDDDLNTRGKLEYLFETLNKKLKEPLILVIDGLDEFVNPVAFLQNFPMQNVPNKLHLVFTTRGYPNILETLQTKLFNSTFNVLNKDKYKDKSISIELEALSKYEVEALISEVLTKDVQRGTDPYQTVQREIYEKSEGLPLYIHYISSKMKNFDSKASNIEEDILAYAKELPRGLDDFYFKSLKKLKTESSEILYTLYFSHKNIGFDSFYHLLTGLNEDRRIDENEFENNHFNEVEIFLSQDKEDKYGFYHLSVKEAIKNYFMRKGKLQSIVKIDYNAFEKNIPIAPYQKEQYKGTFDEYYYLKESSSLFRLLKRIYKYLSDKQNDEYLSELYKDNYLTYFYKYIHFSNYHEMGVVSENTLKIDYEKFKTATLSHTITDHIQNFFKAYASSPKQDISEIKYAHGFALLTNDYDRVLSYAKDYEDAFLTLFIDIIWNIDNPKNQKLFNELKPIWSKVYDNDFKIMLLSNPILYKSAVNVFTILDTLDTLDYDKDMKVKGFIALNLANHKFFEEAFHLTMSIEYEGEEDITKTLNSIALKMGEAGFFSRAIEVLGSIDDEWGRFDTFESILFQIDDHKLVLEVLDVVKNIKDEPYRSDALKSIASKMLDEGLFEEALKVVSNIEDEWDRSEVLESMALMITDPKWACEAAKNIDNSWDISHIWESIALTITEIKPFNEALKAVRNIDHEWYRSDALKSIASKMVDEGFFEEALKLVSNIEDEWDRSKALESIETQIADKKLFVEIEESARNIEDNWGKSVTIVSKIDDHKSCVKSLEIVNNTKEEELFEEAFDAIQYMDNIEEKLESLTAIGSKTLEQKLFKKVVKVIKLIKDYEEKEEILVSLVSNMHEIEKSFAVATNIEDKEKKSFAFSSIVANMINHKLFSEAFDVAKNIENIGQKIYALVTIAYKMGNYTLVEEVFEAANSLVKKEKLSEALKPIISKLENYKLFEDALNALKSIEYKDEGLEIFTSIAYKMDDHKLFKEAFYVAESIEDEWNRSFALESIAFKMSEDKLFEEASAIACIMLDEGKRSVSLASIAFELSDHRLFEEALKVVSSIENEEKRSKVLKSIVSKIDDYTFFEKVFYVPENIRYEWGEYKEFELKKSIIDLEWKRFTILSSVAFNIEDHELFKEAVYVIEYEWNRSIALTVIISQMRNHKLFNEVIAPAIGTEVAWERSTLAASIVRKMVDQEFFEEAVHIAEYIEDEAIRSKVLSLIALKTDDDKEVFYVEESIDDELDRSSVLEPIIWKINDYKIFHEDLVGKDIEKKWDDFCMSNLEITKQEYLVEALNIAKSIEDESKRTRVVEFVMSNITIEDVNLVEEALSVSRTINYHGNTPDIVNEMQKLYNTFSHINNYLYKFNASINFNLNMSVDYVVPYDSDAILRYYGVLDVEDKSPLQILITRLIDQDKKEEDEKDKRIEFNSIKNYILEDDTLLEEFIILYGETLGIEDYSFNDEFSFNTFKENIELFKEKN